MLRFPEPVNYVGEEDTFHVIFTVKLTKLEISQNGLGWHSDNDDTGGDIA